MGPAIAYAALRFCVAGFTGYAVSYLLGVVVGYVAGMSCLGGECGGFARSLATLGGSCAALWGAMAGLYRGIRKPGLSSGTARRSNA